MEPRDWQYTPIVDLSAWTGSWHTLPVKGEVDQVRGKLKAWGVERIGLSPLAAAWCHNPHLCNEVVYEAARQYADIDPVPVLDPTLPTWRQELARAASHPRTWLVRLLPAYSQYRMAEARELLQAACQARLGVIVQTRLEDPRRHHPLAQVPDFPALEVAEMATQFDDLIVVLGGATWRAILDLREPLLALPGFYAEVSQADGLDSLRLMVEAGLGAKLLFGSHAPLFATEAGLARVVVDLEDEVAAAILGGNACRMQAAIRDRK